MLKKGLIYEGLNEFPNATNRNGQKGFTTTIRQKGFTGRKIATCETFSKITEILIFLKKLKNYAL